MKRGGIEDGIVGKNRAYLTASGLMQGTASLWINQIIEEEHESESAADNSASHSRCASNLQTKKNTSGNLTEINNEYNDFVTEA